MTHYLIRVSEDLSAVDIELSRVLPWTDERIAWADRVALAIHPDLVLIGVLHEAPVFPDVRVYGLPDVFAEDWEVVEQLESRDEGIDTTQETIRQTSA